LETNFYPSGWDSTKGTFGCLLLRVGTRPQQQTKDFVVSRRGRHVNRVDLVSGDQDIRKSQINCSFWIKHGHHHPRNRWLKLLGEAKFVCLFPCTLARLSNVEGILSHKV
jgi:hypothetical protein